MIDGSVTRTVRCFGYQQARCQGMCPDAGPSPEGKQVAGSSNVRVHDECSAGVKDWLISERVSVVTMEATGDYWKPAYYLLEDAGFELMLVNARDAKGLPGRKTDVSDSAWLCHLTECGLLRASLVPPEPIRRLRDLTRYRTTTIRERNREAQRLEKVLEDACVKLSAVATDILGVSGRAMMQALIDGERDPQVLPIWPNRSCGSNTMRWSRRRPAVSTITTRSSAHSFILRRIDELSAVIEEVTARIDTELAPFADTIEHLVTIPGIDRKGAAVIIAETGGDMTRFRTAAHLASWAGVCPGSHESGGIKSLEFGETATKHSELPLATRRWAKSGPKTPTSANATTASLPDAVNNEPSSRSSIPCLPRSATCSSTTSTTRTRTRPLPRREPTHVMRRITKQANALGLTVRFDPIRQTAAAT